MRLTVIGLSLLMVVAMVTADDHKYMGLIPKELRNGMNFSPEFVLTEVSAVDVDIDVSIRKTDKTTSDLAFANSAFTITIAAGSKSGQGSVMVPYSVPTGEQYYVHTSFTGLAVKTLPVAVIVYRPALGLFIITDKPLYKPGQTVLIRALSCDKELRPVSKNLTMEIKDSKGNSIWKMMTTDDEKPLIDANFTLSDDPIFGMYKIILFNADGYTEAEFEVKEYVLQRYEVMLELDESFLVAGDKTTLTINGRVRGIYSYGKNVKGMATLKLSKGYGGFDEKPVWTSDNFDGSSMFSIDVNATDLQQPFMFNSYSYSSTLTLRAELKENSTENVESAEASLTVYPKAFVPKMKPMPILFEGNTAYTFQVELTDPQGGPLTAWDGVGSDSLSYYTLYYKTKESKVFNTTEVTANPMSVTVTLDTPANDLSQNEVHAYFTYSNPGTNKREKSQQVYEKVTKYYTYSMKTIEVQMVYNENTAKRCFKIAPFTAGDQAYYMIVNNYYPEAMQEYTMASGYCFDVLQKHAPKTRILVYKLEDYKEGKELLTAYHDVNIDWTPEQQVEVEVFGKDSGEPIVKPGDAVEVVIKTKGEAYVAVKGVDKSVSFMADPNDLTPKALKAAVTAFRIYDREVENKFPNPPNLFPMPFLRGVPEPMVKRKKRCSACIKSEQYMDSRKLLEDSGLLIVTDIPMKRQEGFTTGSSDYDYPVFRAMGGAAEDFDESQMMFNKQDGAAEEVDAPMEEEEEEVEARQEFPETWLWDLEKTNTNGDLRLEREVPDTITNWQVSAIGFNQQYGLSVSGIKELTVFQDFFISMNLPYSVVRTETVAIDILVFNYLDTELKVEVELAASVNYSIKDSNSKFQRELTIAPGNSGLARVMVRFTKIGDIPLDAKATQKINGVTGFVDRVIRELIVKPEGREIRKDDNVVVPESSNNLQATTTEMSFNMSKINIPDYIVPGSLRMYLYVTGDMMGAFISNILTKIKMPFGCGEQNIKSLTPSVFVQRYLRKVGRLDSKTEALVGKVCGAGVRKQFIYLHQDGSYSAFGDRDNVCVCGKQGRKRGSTWLTAYVMTTFSLLYIDDVTYVSPENLKKSFEYIRDHVTYQNCTYQFFVEEGELIHKEMQGGSGSRFGFVAFVTTALMDYKEAAEKAGLVESAKEAGELIGNATAWLVRQEEELRRMKDPYQLAVVGYTLARAGRTSVSKTLLEVLADVLQEKKDNMMTEMPDENPTPEECMYIPSSTPSDVCRTDADCNKGMTNNRYSYNNMQCCKVACKSEKRCSRMPYRPTFREADMIIEDDSDSSMIETNGYALMAYLELHEMESDKTKYIDKIEMLKKWLLSKRKGNGFFSSTQDTVVALRALAKYAMTFPDSNGADFSVRAKVGSGYVTDEVVVNSNTYTVTTERKLDVAVPPNSVSVEVTGRSGTTYANLVAIYNVAKNVTTSPFNVTIEPKIMKNKPYIRTCLSRNGNYGGAIGSMVYMSLQLQTGKQYCGVESETDVPEYAPSKIEHDPTGLVTTYFMDGNDNFKQERCLRICYEETITVEDQQPASIQAVDYYTPERSMEVMYMVDPELSTQFVTTTPVTTGASSAQMNTFLLVATVFIVTLAQFTKSE